jgi:hypothetical protein
MCSIVISNCNSIWSESLEWLDSKYILILAHIIKKGISGKIKWYIYIFMWLSVNDASLFLVINKNESDLVVIIVEFGMEDHDSIPHNYDREEAEITWCQNWSPNQIKLVVKTKTKKMNHKN